MSQLVDPVQRNTFALQFGNRLWQSAEAAVPRFIVTLLFSSVFAPNTTVDAARRKVRCEGRFRRFTTGRQLVASAIDLFADIDDDIELVVPEARYPWFEAL